MRRLVTNMAVVGGVMVLFGFTLVACGQSKESGTDVPEMQGEESQAVEEEKNRILNLLGDGRTVIAWSTNRFGNHEIVLLVLPDYRLVRLTDNANVDYYPRISPEGSRVLFARSQSPATSQRQSRDWDVYLADIRTGEERLVAKNGNVPTWSDDGLKAYFQRNGGEVVEHELATGRERTLYKSGEGSVPDGVELGTPDYNENDGLLAATVRGKRRFTGLFPLEGRREKIGGGCHLTWAPDYAYLYFVDKGGKQKNAFYRYEPASEKVVRILDLEGDYSHEYFPKVSNDNRFIVFGASAGGHEQDVADYEIFLWEIGKPAAEAIRVSFDPANDSWPDMYIR